MDKKKVSAAVQEGVDAMYKIQAQKDLIKSIAERMKDEEDILPAKFNAWVKRSYENDIEDIIAKAEELREELSDIDVK